MMMLGYSSLLALALVLSAPWWLWRMAFTNRYRAGLAERLGRVPQRLRTAAAGNQVVWLHAVSVGEVLGAARLITELQAALPEFVVVVSTTTLTGQTVAREKLQGVPVFYLPLDFAWPVRQYLRALRPRLFVLMESEFWPRLLVECERAGVPVAVVNARISDRSFPRYMRLKRLWRPLLAKVSILLTQSEETAERLRRIGARVERVKVAGNLKFDAAAPVAGPMVRRLQKALAGRTIVVAGSTLAGEEEMLLAAWPGIAQADPQAILVIAPRHPDRFSEVAGMISGGRILRATALGDGEIPGGEVVLLDTVGDLAAIYELARVAFVGGSLVPRGGHNPLEAARFGVPVVMGESYENFREIVEGMRAADAIVIVKPEKLGTALLELMRGGQELGERGRTAYERQAGATARTVTELLGLIGDTH